MARSFRCKIVTPSDAVLDEEVAYATIPASDGQQGVMHDQSPLLTRLAIGSMRVDLAGGGSRRFLVEGGFAQVHSGVLTVLTERATLDVDLDGAAAERELRDANAAAVAGGVDRERVEADQQRARSKRALAPASGAQSS